MPAVGEPVKDAASAVVAAYVCGNEVAYSWHHSIIEMLAFDLQVNQRLTRGGWMAIRYGTGGIVEARNRAVREFLAQDQADWLWWIDTDMGFAPDTVERLFEAADPTERPIVGGLCFSQHEDGPDGMGGRRWTSRPTVFDWVHTDDGQMGWQVRWDFQPNTLTRVGGTGSACILIHRSAFEKVQAEHGQVWYDQVPNPTTGQMVGEDLSFCLRAGALQIPMYVHTGVGTTHFKPVWIGEEDYWTQRAMQNLAEKVAEVEPESVP